VQAHLGHSPARGREPAIDDWLPRAGFKVKFDLPDIGDTLFMDDELGLVVDGAVARSEIGRAQHKSPLGVERGSALLHEHGRQTFAPAPARKPKPAPPPHDKALKAIARVRQALAQRPVPSVAAPIPSAPEEQLAFVVDAAATTAYGSLVVHTAVRACQGDGTYGAPRPIALTLNSSMRCGRKATAPSRHC